jgi:hypothetical protein
MAFDRQTGRPRSRRRNLLKYAFLVPLAAVVGCASQPPQIVKTLPPPAFETWAPQDSSTNIQDWDRVATRIADGLQARGLIHSSSTADDPPATAPVVFNATVVGTQPLGHSVTYNYDHNSTFSQQVVNALDYEVDRRGGAIDNMHVDLEVSIVPWGSRLDSQPYTPRREGVWQATVQVGSNHPTSFREPFHILNSDIGLFVELPPPPPTVDQTLAATARPLQYVTK